MKVQFIGWGYLKGENGDIFCCDYDGYGNVLNESTGEIYEITKRDKNDNPIEIRITEISKLIKGFYSDLQAYRATNKDAYLICAKYTLNKILDKGYRDVYLSLCKAL